MNKEDWYEMSEVIDEWLQDPSRRGDFCPRAKYCLRPRGHKGSCFPEVLDAPPGRSGR